MKDLVGRFIELERSISQEKGGFNLFALFLREDAQDKWDVVVAAPWIEGDKKKALPYLANKLQKAFSPSELLQFSRIVIIDRDNPALLAISQALQVEHTSAEVKDSNFFGLQIKHAYIITSKSELVNELKPAA